EKRIRLLSTKELGLSKVKIKQIQVKIWYTVQSFWSALGLVGLTTNGRYSYNDIQHKLETLNKREERI
ncbi:unnamed protein product, partial [Arabidopsis halleri]